MRSDDCPLVCAAAKLRLDRHCQYLAADELIEKAIF